MSEEEPGPTEGLMERAAQVNTYNGFEAAVMVVFDTAYLAGREAGAKAERARLVALLHGHGFHTTAAAIESGEW